MDILRRDMLLGTFSFPSKVDTGVSSKTRASAETGTVAFSRLDCCKDVRRTAGNEEVAPPPDTGVG